HAVTTPHLAVQRNPRAFASLRARQALGRLRKFGACDPPAFKAASRTTNPWSSSTPQHSGQLGKGATSRALLGRVNHIDHDAQSASFQGLSTSPAVDDACPPRTSCFERRAEGEARRT